MRNSNGLELMTPLNLLTVSFTAPTTKEAQYMAAEFQMGKEAAGKKTGRARRFDAHRGY
ncbi:MAG: hypothetical protein ACRDBO_12295 [Lachnospiraceae bacterium]